jgi:hypothetical protein
MNPSTTYLDSLQQLGGLRAEFILESVQTSVIFADEQIPGLPDQTILRPLIVLVQTAEILIDQAGHVALDLKQKRHTCISQFDPICAEGAIRRARLPKTTPGADPF